MDPKRLIEGYKQILRTIYSSKEYFRRALDCLGRVVQDTPEPHRSNFAGDLAAFSRIVMRLGVFDRERKEFWKYLQHTVLEHRRHFAKAITLAAMGYHFRKLTEEYCR